MDTTLETGQLLACFCVVYITSIIPCVITLFRAQNVFSVAWSVEPRRVAAASLEEHFGRLDRRVLLGSGHAAGLVGARAARVALADAGRVVVAWARHGEPAGGGDAAGQRHVGVDGVRVDPPGAAQVVRHARLEHERRVADQDAAGRKRRVLVAVRRDVGRRAT